MRRFEMDDRVRRKCVLRDCIPVHRKLNVRRIIELVANSNDLNETGRFHGYCKITYRAGIERPITRRQAE